MTRISFKIDKTTLNLYQGHCLEVMKIIPNNIINLLASDPPYGTTQNKWDTIIPLEPLWQEIKRVLVENGNVVFTAAQPFTSQLILSNPQWFKYDMVWSKTIASGQLNVSSRPLRLHEDILVFSEGMGTYNEQMTTGKPYRIIRKGEDFSGCYGVQKTHEKINDGVRHATSIIHVPNPRIKNGHPTQKPVDLFEYLIKTYSNEGDTVLDYCMGSGTTGEACVKLKRNFIGIELDKIWFDRSVERLKNVAISI